jgi:hypothetical protein
VVQPSNPVIILWAHPRSMSTAMERVMRERGDCICLHEPFMYYYYVHLGKNHMPHFDVEQHRPRKFEDIVSLFRSRARDGAVFAKDMSYYVLPEITRHPELASEFVHLFLIRDPRKSLVSYFKLDPDFSCEETGLESQWQLHQWITLQTGNAPLVLEAENIQRDPEAVIGAAWKKIGLSFIPKAFHWGDNDKPSDWHQVDQWHQKTLAKKSIQSNPLPESDIQQEFSRYTAKAPKLQLYLDHHWPFYQKLVAVARGGEVDVVSGF